MSAPPSSALEIFTKSWLWIWLGWTFLKENAVYFLKIRDVFHSHSHWGVWGNYIEGLREDTAMEVKWEK